MTWFVAFLAGTVAGCGWALPDRIHYQHQPETAVSRESRSEQAMVGLALSGGGSRAAVFAAAVLEALAEHGIAERITHISSVSGGGFAASYYVTRPMAAACPDRAPACRRAYFAAFDAAMRQDYTTALLLNQLASPGRITSPTRRATSLQEALDASFLDGTTFGQLPPHPMLLINAASYDDGRRFVFSNAVLEASYPDYPPLARDVLWASSFSLPDCPQRTPPDLPVSLAVVASAAFPPVIGPVTVQSQRSCADTTPQYWHLGDGGIIDNSGADSLRELVVRGVGSGNLTSALIFVADAGAPHDAERSRSTADLSLFTSNPGAVVDVAQARGNALAELAWAQARETIGIPFDTVVFRFNEAEIADWPDSCAAEQASGRLITDHLSAIATALDVGDCEADLLVSAARAIVDRRLAEAAETLRRHGLAPPGAHAAAAQR